MLSLKFSGAMLTMLVCVNPSRSSGQIRSPPATGAFSEYQFARHPTRRCLGRKDAHDVLPNHVNQFPLSPADLSDLERVSLVFGACA
jgi:hypothetical protein